MQSRFEHGGLVWVDLESPTREEVQQVVDEFQIEPLVAQELLVPATKPRAEFHERYAYVVMHFPALHHSHKSVEQEIDFVIGQRFLITTRYETVDPLHKFSKVLEVDATLERNTVEHGGLLFFYMLKRLYRSVEHEVEYARHDLHEIEESIFSGHEIDMVTGISRSARGLLNLRQTIEPHREILRELEESGPKFFGQEFTPYLRMISNEYYRVHNHIMRNTEFLHELRETNNSLLTTKQNETIKTLTIMAFLILPLSFIAELFAMKAAGTPIVGSPGGFWIIAGIMLIAVSCMLGYFKHQHWL